MKRIIKFGGSLFDCEGIAQSLQDWLANHQDLRNIIICGGGRFVDCVRQWDRTHGLSAEAAHWISVDSVSVTSKLLAELLPGAEVTDDPVHATDSLCNVVIFQPARWLRSQPHQPKSWDLTSDSIAASFAVAINSPELVLMKSAVPDGSVDLAALGENGFVDLHFEEFARHLRRIRIVNLRNPLENEVSWSPNPGPTPGSMLRGVPERG